MSRRKQEKPQPRKRSLTDEDDALLSKEPSIKSSPPVDGDKSDRFVRLLEDGDRKPLQKERPNLEPEHLLQQDLLTCGVCQREFALSDIVKFIQHKVHSCNKENCLLYDGDDGGPDDYDSDHRGDVPLAASGVGPRRPGPPGGLPVKRPHPVPNRLSNAVNHSLDLADRLKARVSLEPHVHKYGSRGLLVHDNGGIGVPHPVPPPVVAAGALKSPPTTSPVKRPTAEIGVNTTYTEPNNYTCFTCKHSFCSAWLLIQHAQNLHGLKIYADANISPAALFPVAGPLPPVRRPTPQPPQPPQPVAAAPVVSTVPAPSPASVPAASTNCAAARTSTPIPSESPVASATVASAVTSSNPAVPLPGIVDPAAHHALQLLRMPLSERQFGPGLFGRASSHDFRVGDLLSEQLRLGQPATQATVSQPPSATLTTSSSQPAAATASSVDGFKTSATRQSPQPFGLSLEPQLDFYSQRLRQLAGASSPPAATSTGGSYGGGTAPTSPRKLTPPAFAGAAPPTTPAAATTARATSSEGGPSSRPSSPQLKSCEYCGKSFRFQSNLIVHRRSHTGEKPYRCHICNHACTQASKLKRHMKTHRKSPTSGDNTSVESSRSTPEDGPRTNGDDECAASDGAGSCDEEEDDEELDDEEEEDLEEEDEDLDDEDATTPCGDTAEDLTVRAGPAERKSLLGEVMEKIGLTNIQQYSEAYRQALEESGGLRVKQERPGSAAPSSDASTAENGPDGKTLPHEPLDFGGSLLGAFDGGDSAKRLRLDQGEREVFPGLWLPSMAHRDFYLGLQPDLDRARDLKMGALSPRPGPSNALALIGSALGRPKDRRNDTCEYCGKVFKNCSNLTVHRRSHTGEKPYKCELCSYACAQSSKLTRHMKTHGRVGKDVYRCRFCDMPFSVPSTLEKHMRKCVVNQNAPSVDSDSKDMALESPKSPPPSGCRALDLWRAQPSSE